MVNGEVPQIEIVAAAAAAIITAANLPDGLAVPGAGEQKFVVHPHVADATADDGPLIRYLAKIYSGRTPPQSVAYPTSTAFGALGDGEQMADIVRAMAEPLAIAMSHRRASPGILFGFSVLVDGAAAHGVIKADLDDETRFHVDDLGGGAWTLAEVEQVLPAPRGDFAKYVIAPQPLGTGPAGLRDKLNAGAGAEYFLDAIGVIVPLDEGTQVIVATRAIDAGVPAEEVQRRLATVMEDTGTRELMAETFPEVPGEVVEKMVGSSARPMETVWADDRVTWIYENASPPPRFQLTVDEQVDVEVAGHVITVTLPEGSLVRRRPG